jgi:hypothetical protein
VYLGRTSVSMLYPEVGDRNSQVISISGNVLFRAAYTSSCGWARLGVTQGDGRVGSNKGLSHWQRQARKDGEYRLIKCTRIRNFVFGTDVERTSRCEIDGGYITFSTTK